MTTKVMKYYWLHLNSFMCFTIVFLNKKRGIKFALSLFNYKNILEYYSVLSSADSFLRSFSEDFSGAISFSESFLLSSAAGSLTLSVSAF